MRDEDRECLEVLRAAKLKGKGIRFCVAGAGNGGLSMAGHLGVMGFSVNLYNRTEGNLEGVRWHGGVVMTGAVEGFGPVGLATSDLAEAIEGLIHHMRGEQQLIREWVDAQAVQHREIRRLLEIIAHAPARRE